MTAEEREMFDDLVTAIEANHERVVGKVHEPFQTSLAGDSPATQDGPEMAASTEAADDADDEVPGETETADAGATVGADAASGADPASAGGATADPVPGTPPDDESDAEPTPADASAGEDFSAPDASTSEESGTADEAAARATQGPREAAPNEPSGPDEDAPPEGFVRVRVVEDVPGFVGTDGVEYDPTPDEVLTLPEENADALCARDAAEELDSE